MDAGGRATQEQLPSSHGVNEDFFANFNAARPSKGSISTSCKDQLFINPAFCAGLIKHVANQALKSVNALFTRRQSRRRMG